VLFCPSCVRPRLREGAIERISKVPLFGQEGVAVDVHRHHDRRVPDELPIASDWTPSPMRLATAVLRSSWILIISGRPFASTAGFHTLVAKFEFRMGAPLEAVKAMASASAAQ